jgi:hypothetical protein
MDSVSIRAYGNIAYCVSASPVNLVCYCISRDLCRPTASNLNIISKRLVRAVEFGVAGVANYSDFCVTANEIKLTCGPI